MADAFTEAIAAANSAKERACCGVAHRPVPVKDCESCATLPEQAPISTGADQSLPLADGDCGGGGGGDDDDDDVPFPLLFLLFLAREVLPRPFPYTEEAAAEDEAEERGVASHFICSMRYASSPPPSAAIAADAAAAVLEMPSNIVWALLPPPTLPSAAEAAAVAAVAAVAVAIGASNAAAAAEEDEDEKEEDEEKAE